MNDVLKRKIAALRAKTVAAGCTESEAMAAAAMAAKLMATHGIDAADLDMTTADSPGIARRSVWRRTLDVGIAGAVGCALLHDPNTGTARFYGAGPAPEIACYLRDVTYRAVLAVSRAFKDTPYYLARRKTTTRRKALEGFADAMVWRLVRRLYQLFASVRRPADLDRANAILARDNPTARDTSIKRRQAPVTRATLAGWHAGGNVPLHQAAGTDAAPKALEDRT